MAELPSQVCTVHRRMARTKMNPLMSGDPSAADSGLLQKLKLMIDAAVNLLVRNGESLRACNWDDTAATLAFRLNVKYHVWLQQRFLASPRLSKRDGSVSAGII
jgi:hypothetical protein